MNTREDLLFGDLRRIHQAITRALETSSARFDQVIAAKEDDAATYVGFALYLKTLFELFVSHHHGEDTIGFPALEARSREFDLEALRQDHHRMHPLLLEGKQLAEKILRRTSTVSPDDDARLREIIVQLSRLWTAHVGPEETCFSCELAMTCLTAGERDRLTHELSRHGQQALKPMSRFAAFIYYHLDQDDQAAFVKPIPGFVARFLIEIVWKGSWKPMLPFLLPEAAPGNRLRV